MTSLGPTAHTDTFARDNLPPSQQWPQISLDGFAYPDYLNAAVELTDRMVARGFGDHVALIGNGRRRTYKELSDWTNRHRPRPGRGLRRQARQSHSDPRGQQSGDGRVLAGGDQGRRRGRQHHAACCAPANSARSSTKPRSRWRCATPG